MARKKIVPKKLGSVKIPKNLRRIGDKALADPQVAGIVSGALASVGAIVAAHKVAGVVPGGSTLTHAMGSSTTVGSVTDVVKQAFEDVLDARCGARGKLRKQSKAKGSQDEPDVSSVSEPEADLEAEADRLH